MYAFYAINILCASWLSKLQKSIDFTVPLYKWDASYLQAGYYTSIKVDPMVHFHCKKGVHIWTCTYMCMTYMRYPHVQALHVQLE